MNVFDYVAISPVTKTILSKIPLLTVKAGYCYVVLFASYRPRDGDQWIARLKEEYSRLIEYISINKKMDSDWFRIESNKTGNRWTGKCWYFQDNVKYEFDLQFEIPITYPMTPIEIELPELDGKTAKMYRGGKICLTIHFKPLWAKNAPHFGIAHALALGLAPWLAAEIPHLVSSGVLTDKVKGNLEEKKEAAQNTISNN